MTNEIKAIHNINILIYSHFEFAENIDIIFEIMRVIAVNILPINICVLRRCELKFL